MDLAARRYTQKILLIHLLLLLAVVGIVALAVGQIYSSARAELTRQAQDRQQQLALQTATAIQSYYKSIEDDLDLIYRAEHDEADAVAARSATQPAVTPAITASEKRTDDSVVSHQAFIRQVIWKQLESRVALLFSYEHPMVFRRIDRVGGLGRGGGGNGGGNGGIVNGLGERLGGSGLGGGGMLLPDPRQDLRAQLHAVVIGSTDPQIKVNQILAESHDWITSLTAPAIHRFQIYNGKGVNLVAVPMQSGTLVAVVPIAGVEGQYLRDLNDDPLIPTGAWLIDHNGTAMAASQPQFVGGNIDAISDDELRASARNYISQHLAGSQVTPRPFKFGGYPFGPTMISGAPVKVTDATWELFVATPMSKVDGTLARLFHGSVLWSIFVMLAITGILASTAIQMIRSRLRLERLRHEALERELAQAREIQLAWLPDCHPVFPLVRLAAINSPASHISGDFYNWFELHDGRLVVVIGDVTGHGMAAAFLMATTQLLVRNTMTRLIDPARCLEEVNRQLCVQVFNGQFVTMLLLLLDLSANRLSIATAGHPAPMIAVGDTVKELPVEPQLVLGVDRDTTYTTEHYDLPQHTSLLLYTDGVVECPDQTDNRFGADRLRETLTGNNPDAQSMINRVVEAVDHFRGPRHLDDDLTVVAVQLTGEPSRLKEPEEAAA